MTDDPGVMGNLPRSRPGQRSKKRASEVKPPAADRSRKTGSGKAASSAKPAGSAQAKTGGAQSKARGSQSKARGSQSKARGSQSKARGSQSKARGPQPKAARATAARTNPRATAPRTAVRDERVEERQGQDPITAALKFGMAVGDAGVKAVAKIVQRLPRP